MNPSGNSGPGKILAGAAVLAVIYGMSLLLKPVGAFSLLTHLIRLAFYGFIGLLVIAAVIIGRILYKEKQEKEHPDPEKSNPASPARVEETLTAKRLGGTLGPVARSALAQKKKLAKQLESYQTVAARRFGQGSITYQKYMSIENSAAEALEASFVKIVNRMDIFDDHEYNMLRSGQYKSDAIPDSVQEQKLAGYDKLLAEMQEILEENEKVLISIDDLMVQMADSAQTDDHKVTEEVEELVRQLEFYQQHS